MATSYDDALAQLSSGLGGDTTDQPAPQPKSFDEALSSLSSGLPANGSAAPQNDWWGQYWGHLTDQASQAYHDSANDGTPSMPSTDPMTMDKLIAGRKTYLDDVNAASDPDADSDTKTRAATSARRLSRIDQVLSLMGQGPDQPMTDASAADLINGMSHPKLMASDRYRQVYDSASPELMSEDQRQAYAKDTIAKEVSDLPWQRDSIMAQVSGAPSGSVMEDYGKNALSARQSAFYRDHDSDVPLPSVLQPSAPESVASGGGEDMGTRAFKQLGIGAAATEETLVKALSYLSPATANNPEMDAALSEFHKSFITDQTPAEAKNFGEQLADAPGQALKIIAPALLAGPAGEALAIPEVAAGADALMPSMTEQAWNAIADKVSTALPGAIGASIPMGQDRYDAAIKAGATPAEAAALVAEHAPADIAMNLMPVAAEGSTLARAGQGAASQATLTAGTEYAETGHVDPGQVAIAAATGAGLGAVHPAGAPPQSAGDVTAARAGFDSEAQASAHAQQTGQSEARFSKVLDQIGDNPEAKARADVALAAYNDGSASALRTMAELKHIAETGQSRDEEAYAATQAAKSPVAAEMGVTPDAAAAERTSEDQAGAQVFGDQGAAQELSGSFGDALAGHEEMTGQREDDSLPQTEGIDDTPRFRLDHEPEAAAPEPEKSRPAEEVAQLPPLEVPAADHITNPEPIADVGRAYHEIAQEPSTHQMAVVPPEARTLSDITEAVDPNFRVKQLPNERGNGQLYQIDTPSDRGPKPVFLKVEPGGRLQLDATQLREGSGMGSRIYHIVNEFAHRNRYTAAPDDAGLSEVNTFRRTEQQLASAARTRDTSHLVPDYTQQIAGWKPGRPTRDNTRSESEFNTGLLAHRAMENTHAAVPDSAKLRYNFDNERYEWSDGRPATEHDFTRLAGSPEARASGAGSSSIKRAVWTASLLRERGAGRRPDVLAQASRERLASGWRGAGDVAPDRFLYRLGADRGLQDHGGEVGAAPTEVRGERVPAAVAEGATLHDGSAGQVSPDISGRVETPTGADAAATHPSSESQPTLGQQQAGNYRKGHVKALGLDISIENPRGSTRSGIGADGRPFSRVMNHHYGYIKGTIGADGDHLDVLLGDQPDNPSRQVFVVDQKKPDGGFDEHKVLMGFRNQRAAEQAYLSEYPKGWQGMGRVRSMSAPEFKTWTKGAGREEAHTGPVADAVPRVTLRHQQPDAVVSHASADVSGTSATAARADLPRLDLPNAGMPSQRRVVMDEVPRGGAAPDDHSSAVLRNVYDLGRDPRGLMQKARNEVEQRGLPLDADHVINEFERQVVANGFDGYRSEGKVAVLGHDVPVAKGETHETTQHGPDVADETGSRAEDGAHGTGDAGSEGGSGTRDQGAGLDGESRETGKEPDGVLPQLQPREAKVAYSGPGMSKSAASGLVKLLKWNGAVDRIEIHQSEASMPASLRDRITPGFRGKVHGIYDPTTGKVHIIADKMSSPRELYRTLTEEHLGHGGLRKVFNQRDLNEMLDRAWGSVPKDDRAAISRDYKFNLSLPGDRRSTAEEYLAKLEPDGRGKTTFEKFRDWFNSTSRKMGRDVDYSPSELRSIMQAAHDNQRAGLSPSIASRSAVDLVTPRNGLDGGFHLSDDGEATAKDLRYRIERMKGTPEQEASRDRTMSPAPEDLSLGDRARAWYASVKARDWGDTRASWLQGWLDSGNQVKRIERGIFGGFLGDAAESPYKMYNLAKNSHAVMAAIMKLGAPEYKDGSFQPVAGRKGVFEIFRPLYEHPSGKSLMPLWEQYAAATRASRLIKETNINGTSREKNFTQHDIDQGLKLGEQYPELKRVSADFQEFNNHLLDLAADRGAISPEEAASWKENFYVPFYRAVEELENTNAGKTRKGSAASNQKIYSRRLTGSENKVDNVFENILGNTAYIVDRTYRQEFMNRLLDMGEGVVLHKVPMANRSISVSVGDLARALNAAGIISGTPTHGAKASPNIQPSPHWSTAEVDRLTQGEKEKWSRVFQRVAPIDPDIVPIMRDGKMGYYRVSDPLLLRTIGAMGHDSFGKMISFLGGAKRVVTWGVTKDPGFMAATWFRDALINWVGSETPITPFVDNIKGAFDSVRGDPIVSKLMMAGVGVAPHYETQGSTVRGALERNSRGRFLGVVDSKGSVINTAKNALDFYNRVGIAAEASSRLAIARAVLQRGGSMAEAAYQAQDILNYSMRGDYVAARMLAQTAPFWNAGMQGLYRFMRGAGIANARAGDASQLTSYMLRGSALLGATLVNAWRNKDDPDYNRLADEDKNRYWHFFIGDQHFKLPKPFEAGVVFGSIPERIVQRLLGNDTTKDTMKNVLTMALEEMRLNPLPQVARQGIEQWANKDTSSGRPIVPGSSIDELPQDQYSPYTSYTARTIANAVPEKLPWLNSPQRVEHLTRALAGTIGVYALQAGDWVARMAGAAPPGPASRPQDMPVAKRFYGGTREDADRSKYEDKLYDLKGEADATFNSFEKAVIDNPARAEELSSRAALAYRPALDKLGKEVSVLRSDERQVMDNPFIGPVEKRQQLDDITSTRVKLLDEYGPMLNELEGQF